MHCSALDDEACSYIGGMRVWILMRTNLPPIEAPACTLRRSLRIQAAALDHAT